MGNPIFKAPPRTDVPLVHKTCELYKLFHKYLKVFPKTEKYSLGKKIDILIIEILDNFLQAAYSAREKKIDLLEIADTKINLLKTLIRLANEVQALNNNKYLLLQEKLQEIGKMTGGWKKSISYQKQALF